MKTIPFLFIFSLSTLAVDVCKIAPAGESFFAGNNQGRIFKMRTVCTNRSDEEEVSLKTTLINPPATDQLKASAMLTKKMIEHHNYSLVAENTFIKN